MKDNTLIIDIIESRAKTRPAKVWAQVPKSDHDVLGLHDITYASLKRAIDKFAWWMKDQVPDTKVTGRQTVAYIGPADIRYPLVLLAGIKAGCMILCPSHRNSLEANTHLFESVKCSRLFHGSSVSLAEFPTDVVSNAVHQVPSLADLLEEDGPAKPFVYESNPEHPLMCVHTSGSTGLPKPIVVDTGMFAMASDVATLPDVNGFPVEGKIIAQADRVYVGFPIFHFGALVIGLTSSLYNGSVWITPPPKRALDNQLLREMVEHVKPDAAMVTPRVIEEYRHIPEAIADLSSLKWIITGGGSLPVEQCTRVAKVTTLVNLYGSTETWPTHIAHSKPPEDWEYSHFDPQYNSIEWRPVENLFELVVKRDPRLVHRQNVFRHFPNLTEFATGDLFSPHPTLANHWRIEGRVDHLMIFSNASKLQPTRIEANLPQLDPVIQGAFVIGTGRPFPSLLVELAPSSFQNDEVPIEVLERVHVAVRTSNASAPANGQIERQHVILVTKHKPLPRTGKDTVSKNAAEQLYGEEIEAVYRKAREDGYHRDINERLEA